VVSFDPGDACTRYNTAEGFENSFSNRNFLKKALAGSWCEIKAGDLPKILEVTV
jgi:hypothetical protein